ncbi:MAG: TonB-dependent receptor [Bacteroidota bacterium]|nr:TonB-dependent receptor [Bacteroidota bacterium]
MLFASLLTIYFQVSVADTTIKPTMSDSLKEDIMVNFVRASEQTPVTQTNLSEKEIKEKYHGQDIGFVLQSTPSIIARSDAGLGIGYTDFRMRGIDNTRINFSINGIPVNDPENQGFYTNNFADLASSAKSIQIQRGTGTTANGTAPYAGSVNIVTKDALSPASFGFHSNYGSYNTHRVTAEYNTGVLGKSFGFYGRLSSLGSDGYRQGSWSDLKTYFFSAAHFGKKYLFKFNAFGGITRSGLAWAAINKDSLTKNRTYNPLSRNETDEFQQSFYQGQFSYFFNTKLTFSSSVYYVKGIAPRFASAFPGTPYSYANMPNYISPSGKDTARTADFLMNYRLNQDLVGGMGFLNYSANKMDITLGFHANYFQSSHFMDVLSASAMPMGYQPGHQVYFNTGYKSEISSFIKVNYLAFSRLFLFFDFQYRAPSFSYSPNTKTNPYDSSKVESMNWQFVNPRIGGRWIFNESMSIYGSIGMVSREPTRFDYLQDDRANFNVKQSDIKPESVLDLEAGTEYKSENTKFSANLYWMEFTNEIASTGAINNYGYLIRKNVKSSFKSGIEIAYNTKVMEWLGFNGGYNFSYNKIREFSQNYTVYLPDGSTTTKTLDFKDKDPLLTPNVLIYQGVVFTPMQWINFELIGRYVGKSYLDNTQNDELSIPEYALLDFKTSLLLSKYIKGVEPVITFQINNLTNTLYAPAGVAGTPYQPGTVFSRDASGNDVATYNPLFYPAATRNIFLGLSLKF